MNPGDVLVTLRARVDAHFAAAVRETPASFRCGPGCDRCCHQRFGVFAVEAAPIRGALGELGRRDPALRRRVRAQADDPAYADRCALLVDGRCAVYDARPIICRTHGLPLAVPVDPDVPAGPHRVDHCPKNFTDAPPPRAALLRLAAVNDPLCVLAELRDPGAPRVELAALARGGDERDAPAPPTA